MTTHLHTIERLTGLKPGQVNTEDPLLLRGALHAGYWLEHDYVLTGTNQHQREVWMWFLSTVRFPDEACLEQPLIETRDGSAHMTQDTCGKQVLPSQL